MQFPIERSINISPFILLWGWARRISTEHVQMVCKLTIGVHRWSFVHEYIVTPLNPGSPFLKGLMPFTSSSPQPLPMENHFLKKRILHDDQTCSPFQKGLPRLPGVNIYIITPGNPGSPFWKGLMPFTSSSPNPLPIENPFLKKRIPWWSNLQSFWKRTARITRC